VPLRGNVPTRVAKLAAGQQVDAIVLAAAGLSRLALDLSAFAVIELDPRSWVPAPGQGALAAQWRTDDGDVAAQIAGISHADCQAATGWEREFLRVIEGGCSTPFGCYIAGNRVYLGMATERGWAARSIELPDNLSEESQRESFIRAAVDGCKPVELAAAAGAVGRTLFAR
jgi:porphobilinogen deaminase